MAQHRQAIIDSAKSIASHTAAIAEARLGDSRVWEQVEKGKQRADAVIRHRGVMLPVDRLLLGGPGDLSAKEYAGLIGDKTWPSTPLVDGPHVDLYQRFAEGRDVPDVDERFEDVRYVSMAQACIAAVGSFHGASNDTDIEGLIERRRTQFASLGGPSAVGPAPVARPVRGSDCYEVVDGHERLALAWVRGEQQATVDVTWTSTVTPVQELLEQTAWLGGQREIYQPLPWPEIQREWPLIRACTDRLAMMQTHLDKLGVTDGSYLDIASCYGWFVSQMADAGFDAEGIEMDPLGVELGELAYGLPADRTTVGAAEQLLRFADRTWDVVSCMSLIHHHAIMGGDQATAEMLRLLDDSTVRVLYFDTGQAHEAWFAEKLPDWDDDGVADLVRRHTSFTNVEVLGHDADNRGRYADNYRRAFFACTRD